jgi:dTDP-4-amino-4,6-dideoxygalactose transaminase
MSGEVFPPTRIFLSPPHLGGEEARFLQEAIASNYIAPLGPMVDALEREVREATGHAAALALSSGTAAIHLALRVLGIGPGDTVCASTLTFIGSVTPALFLGATPVFVDADPATWNMDPALLEKELARAAREGELPRAVVPTDLYGQCADMDAILEVCGRHGVPVVADAAEAMGALYKGRAPGKGARAAVYSFNGNKIITTSGGGMLVSDDTELVLRARRLSQQARDPAPWYEHSEIGYNYRMSNLLAAVGRGQLRALPERVRQKRAVYAGYRARLEGTPGIGWMPDAPYGGGTRWLTVITVDKERFGADPEDIRLALAREGIEARPVWKPMHLQPVFGGAPGAAGPPARVVPCRTVGGAVAENLFRRGLCLPSGTALTEGDLDKIAEILLSCRGGV